MRAGNERKGFVAKTCVIWRITDGKRGHERQTQGLAQALARLMPVSVSEIRAESPGPALWHWLAGHFSPGRGLAPPDLIVGAGHGTHLTMLAAQRAYGGKTVVLMKPSLPLRCFDLCLIPEHDGVSGSLNVLTTQGAINVVQPSGDKDAAAGLILLGGGSAHYRWDAVRLAEQIRRLVTETPSMHWALTTSPRTPSDMLARLRELESVRFRLTPFDAVPGDWLPAQLERAAQVWVTPDSVSMLYEALTSGAAVGVLDMERLGAGRVSSGVERLLQEGRAGSYSGWVAGQRLPVAQDEFNEAARCARWIKQHWFPEN